MRLTFPVKPDGLRVSVVVGLDGATLTGLLSAGKPVPPPLLVEGEVDTGSNTTGVSSSVLSALGAVSFAASSTQTAAGQAKVQLFKVSLSIPQTSPATGLIVLASAVNVLELPAPLPGIDVLIGLDILLNGKLFLDGPARQFTLEV